MAEISAEIMAKAIDCYTKMNRGALTGNPVEIIARYLQDERDRCDAILLEKKDPKNT